VSAVPEVVADGETGVLAPAGDANGIALGLAGLLADPQRAARMGAAGHDRARSEFSVARMTERTIELYREVA
jgi:glycosyltransferase involved in cell wall biosynthesis